MSEPRLFAAADPFGRTAPLLFESTIPLLGVPLWVRTNAEAALPLVEHRFAGWRALPEALISGSLRATLDIVVEPATGDPLPADLRYRRHGPVFLSAAGPVLTAVVLAEQHALAFVPAQALDDAEWFGAHVCGPALLAVTQRTRVPLHAAAVVAGDHTLLLAGGTGTGKSTMAYASAAAGFSVLAEDTVFVDLSSSSARLWGHAPQVWLAADSRRFFPELDGAPIVDRANGKRRIAARAAGPWQPTLTTAGRVSLVLLERSGGGAALSAIDAEAAADAIERDDTSGFDQYPEGRRAVVGWLRTLPAWRLDTGRSPREAAALLEGLVARQPRVSEPAFAGRAAVRQARS